jgi:methionyl-tRNA formyltransferase
VDSLLKFNRQEIVPAAQDSAIASYAPILKKEDGRIDWALPAQQIYNRMRGFDPWPGAFTTFRGQTCHVRARPKKDGGLGEAVTPGEIIMSEKEMIVACGELTCLRVESVQLEGRKRISAHEFANGARLISQDRFV